MNASLFGSNADLDVAFLDEAYANDVETAAYVFQMYLEELPINLNLLLQSLKNQDIDSFRQLIHKQKPGYSYVGLTGITNKLHDLQLKCFAGEDLILYKKEIDEVINKIDSSAHVIEKTLIHLQQYKRA